MGQKVHPTGIRLGITESHRSVWYAGKKHYADWLLNDMKTRNHVRNKLKNAFVGRIQIERPAKNARITIHTARPGVVIGKKGEDIEQLRQEVSTMRGVPVHINIEMFRRAMKRAVSNALRFGAKGVKICVAGRLGGAEIARTEWYREGRVPLHTFRADIDFATAIAKTTYGIIGVKVWIFKGEVFDTDAINTGTSTTVAVPEEQQ